MKHDIDAIRILESGLLRLYRQAVHMKRWEIAEHLLCALEDLEKCGAADRPTVEQAYLGIRSSPSRDYLGPGAGRTPAALRRRS